MGVHVGALVLILLGGAITYHDFQATRSRNRRFVFFSFLIIFLVQALRSYYVGNDTIRYVNAFNRMAVINNWTMSRWETLYLLINKIVAHFTSNPQWLLVVCALVMDVGFCVFILKNTDDDSSAFWPVFLFMVFLHYVNSMNVVREYLAISVGIQITWVMRDYTGARRWIISALLIFIASQFHAIALIMAIALILYIPKNISFKTVALSSVAVVIVMMLFDRVFSQVLRIFPQYFFYEGTSRFTGTKMGFFYLSYSLFQVFMALLTIKLDPDDDENRTLYWLSSLVIVSAGLLLLKTRVAIALRTGYFFSIFLIIYTPYILKKTRRHNLYYFFLLAYGIFFFFHTLGSAERGVLPYTFFWQYGG